MFVRVNFHKKFYVSEFLERNRVNYFIVVSDHFRLISANS